MLALDSFGTGSDVVLLNGTPSAPAQLAPLATRLAPLYRTWIVHLPGTGGSGSLVPYDLEGAHRQVEEALLARGIRAAHFVGVSGGAYRALALAVHGRVRVRSVVSLAGFRTLTPEQRSSYRDLAAFVRTGADLGAALPAAILSPAGLQIPQWTEEVSGWVKSIAAKDLAAEWDAFAACPALDISGVSVPILARVGELDTAMPPARSEDIVTHASDGSLHVVPGVAHALLLEDFEATCKAIASHLTRAEAAG
jgi:pimeloyl-ACP methyl ester carboxylesterase